MTSRSLAALTVSMWGSRSGYFSPHAFANERARFRLASSTAGEPGTESGRSGAKYPGTQSIAGSLFPTPRGSKPITSYCAAIGFGSEDATNPAMERPLPPGPPGLTNRGPWKVSEVCGIRERARVICRPDGSS